MKSLVRVLSIVLLLAGGVVLPGAAPALAAAPAAPATAPAASDPAPWTPPLSTRGRYIVDAQGNRFRLRSGNWDGAQGSWNGSGNIADPANHHAGQDSHGIPLGLDRVPLPALLADFRALGLNSVRLPFSNEMLHTTAPVPDAAVAANSALRGRTPLQVYDAVVSALTDAGFAVILNNHTGTTRWCCGLDGNERWNSSRSTAQWADDWVFLARRYRDNPRVVGADLYNEVRRDTWDDPNWGLGDGHDWQAASEEAADRILTEANPNLLIVVEGINWTGIPADGLPHGRPALTPVRTLSHTLVVSNKLVYSAHFYGYTGPHHSGATGLGETHDARYQDMSRAELEQTLYDQAFFVSAETGAHFTAPVWISEFGIGADETGAAPRAWFQNMTGYLAASDADFAYWPLVGWSTTAQGAPGGDSWAMLRYDNTGRRWGSPRTESGGGVLDPADWRTAPWTALVSAAGRTGPVPATTAWYQLSTDHRDQNASLLTRAAGDWDSGARKAVCPDGARLAGLSHTGGRGLCSTSDLRAPGGGQTVVRDETYVPAGGDWATGYTKLQCPAGQFLTGYSLRGDRVSAALCAPARVPLAGAGRTVWFDRGDARPAGNPGGDYASGHYKGQCLPTEYAAGIAFTARAGFRPSPASLLCRALPAG
ncbi:aryl-phospho-beta-D-glucosidase BglC (GH1 family) [Streptomyces sp. 3211.6]|uniref:glycoside hydrolase family 5 protein n=1 Tax=Streptomyces sp. 3211.6 TaxID=1938845 RepID=UPI000EAD1B5A|nr:cellulase family glycosylhydrolase [Streptomyces sp. 3211.6]RKT03103.1 aryl-phospho-beta-D-glucosidase BglC (GH1 family) [Streptomyces sp. 3211.6]